MVGSKALSRRYYGVSKMSSGVMPNLDAISYSSGMASRETGSPDVFVIQDMTRT